MAKQKKCISCEVPQSYYSTPLRIFEENPYYEEGGYFYDADTDELPCPSSGLIRDTHPFTEEGQRRTSCQEDCGGMILVCRAVILWQPPQ